MSQELCGELLHPSERVLPLSPSPSGPPSFIGDSPRLLPCVLALPLSPPWGTVGSKGHRRLLAQPLAFSAHHSDVRIWGTQGQGQPAPSGQGRRLLSLCVLTAHLRDKVTSMAVEEEAWGSHLSSLDFSVLISKMGTTTSALPTPLGGADMMLETEPGIAGGTRQVDVRH